MRQYAKVIYTTHIHKRVHIARSTAGIFKTRVKSTSWQNLIDITKSEHHNINLNISEENVTFFVCYDTVNIIVCSWLNIHYQYMGNMFSWFSAISLYIYIVTNHLHFNWPIRFHPLFYYNLIEHKSIHWHNVYLSHRTAHWSTITFSRRVWYNRR